MFNVLAAAKETIGATSDLKVGCENTFDKAKLKFYCETKKNGFLVESNENLKISVAASDCTSNVRDSSESVLNVAAQLGEAGLSCQPPVEPSKPPRKCKISENVLKILGKNADYYEEDNKIVFFCDVTKDNVHQRKGEPKYVVKMKRGRCPKDRRLMKTLKRRAKGLCDSGSSSRKFGEIQRQYKPLEHVYGSQYRAYKSKFAEQWKSRSNSGGIARGGFSRGPSFLDRMSNIVNFGPMARPSFPSKVYSKKPSGKWNKKPKNQKKNPTQKRNDTGCMRKCEPDAETEKHYEKIGTMTCANGSRYTVTCHDGRSITVWWRRNCRKTLLQAEDFCARSD